MAKPYAADFNMAILVDENGEMTIGAHLTDSSGLDASSEVKSDNYMNALEAVAGELLDSAMIHRKKMKSKENIDAKKKEVERLVNSLRADRDLLDQRIEYLNKKMIKNDFDIDFSEKSKPAPVKRHTKEEQEIIDALNSLGIRGDEAEKELNFFKKFFK